MSATSAPIAWLDGAVDLHVHCAPSVFPRWGDGIDVVNVCSEAGMAGVLLKAHEGTTHELASALDRLTETLNVAGGIVLNRYVGGINPAAVEVALKTGAVCVWFPTVDACDHVRAFGSTGGYPAQSGGTESSTGIGVVDEHGALTAPARDVLELVAAHGAMVATGHIGAREIDAVVDACRELNIERVLIQHPCFPTPGLDLPAMVELVNRGAVVELTYLSVSPMWQNSTVADAARVLNELGGDNVVVSSDAGQLHNPSPPEALRSFAQSLHEQGVSEHHVRRAICDTPRRLLGLELP